ncbi:hypothetical protein PMAYCL1PPCAC_09817 [Pristionchus mayeri]|uniref:Uncharacterized protein n=1 Tax=Pristionchus mayeri TaxID=1317129 RepID=A0AAN4ZEB7_9BILA|nr:hypothetical protein PMAYCL1PPCAC_09817 [Pristionchus mayeri]
MTILICVQQRSVRCLLPNAILPQAQAPCTRMFSEYGHLLEKVVADCIVPIDVAHYILMALSVREETGPSFALQHPFASWFCTLLLSFSGTFLTNFLLGESLLVPLMSKSDMIIFTVIWYHISILDSFASICNWKPVKNVLYVAKEFQRNHKIMLGVHSGAAKFVDYPLLHVIIGCTKGNGSGVVKIVQQFVYGKWVPVENEVLKPSTTTKATMLAAFLFASRQISHEVAYLCGACVLVGSKVLAIAGVAKSPLEQPFDRLRFSLIEVPRMLESLICGSSAGVDPAKEEEEKPLIEEEVASSTSEVTSSEVEKADKRENEEAPPPPVVASPWTLEEWQRLVTESLQEIAEMGRSNHEDIGRVNRVMSGLDEEKTETASVQTQILTELRELKGLILAHPPRSPNPSLDSTVLLNVPGDAIDED